MIKKQTLLEINFSRRENQIEKKKIQVLNWGTESVEMTDIKQKRKNISEIKPALISAFLSINPFNAERLTWPLVIKSLK